MARLISLLFLPFLLSAIGQVNPEDVIHWIGISADDFGDGRVEAGVRLTTEQNFTIYADKIEFFPPTNYSFEDVVAPPTTKQLDPVSGKEVDVYTGGDFVLKFKNQGSAPAPRLNHAADVFSFESMS